MAETSPGLLDSWPGLKEDLQGFLADTDAWLISNLKQASKKRSWETINKIIDVMETVHNISHSHPE